MVRTQIQLTEDQHRRLKRWARQRGIPLSEAVRRCVTERLSADEQAPSRADRVRAVLALAAKYIDPDAARRVSTEHDRYLADAYRR